MSAARRQIGGSRYLYDSFEAAEARFEAQERVFEARKEALEFRIARLETAVERLEKRLWLAVYGVVAGVLLHGALALVSIAQREEKPMEYKFTGAEVGVTVFEGHRIAGYASVFGLRDKGGDTVAPGAYAASLKRMATRGDKVRMLWQHDPAQPIGIWDEVHEDAHGLHVTGRLLPDVARAREAQALLEAGAVDGLSIGYRTLRAEAVPGGGRKLIELDLWEVSLVTFPMQPEARVSTKSDTLAEIAALTARLRDARAAVARL